MLSKQLYKTAQLLISTLEPKLILKPGDKVQNPYGEIFTVAKPVTQFNQVVYVEEQKQPLQKTELTLIGSKEKAVDNFSDHITNPIIKSLVEFNNENSFSETEKEFFGHLLETLKKYPQLLHLEHFTNSIELEQSYQSFKTLFETANHNKEWKEFNWQSFYYLEHHLNRFLDRADYFKLPKDQIRALHVLIPFLDTAYRFMRKIELRDSFGLQEKGIPLASGAFGIIFQQNGYMEKYGTLTEEEFNIYQWLAEQDHNFYQQVPIVRILSIEDTGKTRRSDKVYKIIMEEVTTLKQYRQKLNQQQTARFLLDGNRKVVELNPPFSTTQILYEQLNYKEYYPIPSSATLFKNNQIHTLSLNDVHINNLAILVKQGTQENPDRLVHIDLDSISLN